MVILFLSEAPVLKYLFVKNNGKNNGKYESNKKKVAMKTAIIITFCVLWMGFMGKVPIAEATSLVKKPVGVKKAPPKHKKNRKKSTFQFSATRKELKNRPHLLFSPIVFKRLKWIHRLMGKKGSEKKALALIQKLEAVAKKRPFELAHLYMLQGKVYRSLDDYKNAFLFYQKAIDLKQLPFGYHLSVIFDIATLHLFQNNLLSAKRLIDRWFDLADEPTAEAYVLKAYIFIEKGKKNQALDLLMLAIKSTSHPRESWLSNAASLLTDRKKYVSAAQVLEKLVAHYPDKKQYWKYLSSVYLSIRKEDRAVATLDLAYKLDFLDKEREIVHLTSLLMYKGQPLKAGKLLQKAIRLKKVKKTYKNYELLGDCWFSAEETTKALKAYQLSAQIGSKKQGDLFAKIGRIYLDQEKWSKVIKYYKLALLQKKLKKPEYSHISMGVAYFNLKQYKKAIQSFEQVAVTKAKVRLIKIAREWINHVKQYMLKATT